MGAANAEETTHIDASRQSTLVLRLEYALRTIAERHDRPALASSLSAEDMVITDAIARLGLSIEVFTLDTLRLHDETLDLIAQVKARYGLTIQVFRPDPEAVRHYEGAHGRDAFYESVALRQACCAIRKVEPLERALAGRDAWITGQRRDQAQSRTGLGEEEHDAARNAAKYNPLAAWTFADVAAYAAEFGAPMSPLYARGYISIGCEPCTKAIRPGEDPRAGRWWWETSEGKECGLHVTPRQGTHS